MPLRNRHCCLEGSIAIKASVALLELTPPSRSRRSHCAPPAGADESPPPATTEPPVATTVVRERGKFSISCKVPMSHVPLWLKDDVAVLQSEGYQLQQEYPTPAANGTAAHVVMRLSVERAQLSHAGNYKCSSFSSRSHRILVVAGKAHPHRRGVPWLPFRRFRDAFVWGETRCFFLAACRALHRFLKFPKALGALHLLV